MSETSRKFSRNSVHKWLKLWKRVLCCCMLLPLMWNHSKTSVFRVTRPLHVGRLQQTSPTHQELHKSSLFEHSQFVFCFCCFLCPEMTQKYTNTCPTSCLCCLTEFDWWCLLDQGLDYFLKLQHVLFYFFDCAFHTGLRRRHPAKPFSFNCYLIFFCNLTLTRCNLILSTCTKKGCLTATWFCLSTTRFA